MGVQEIQAKSILRKHRKIDSWFVSRYGMNLYRGCVHDCVYCDGRSERYYVEGSYGRDVSVKVNAPDILEKELNPERKRVPLKKGFILLGGGVSDSYQPVNQSFQLTRRVLRIIEKHGFPVHILTKSIGVKNDIDILKRIDRNTRAIVSFSFSSVDDRLCSIFEPGVPGPGERLKAMGFFKQQGLACGMFFMPAIPFISDRSTLMEGVLEKGKRAGADFVIFGGLTLKTGIQKNHFLKVIDEYYPRLSSIYRSLYKDNRWGHPHGDYFERLNTRFFNLAGKYRIPVRIPRALYGNIVDEQDRVIVILEHMDYLLKMEGKDTSFGYAAHSISKTRDPFSAGESGWKKLPGIGPFTAGIIEEIIKTGTADYYEKLMAF